MKIKEIYLTCSMCPSQWEGRLDDGRLFYLRYRSGFLSLHIANNTKTSDILEIIDEDCEHFLERVGFMLDGHITLTEVSKHILDVDFSSVLLGKHENE